MGCQLSTGRGQGEGFETFTHLMSRVFFRRFLTCEAVKYMRTSQKPNSYQYIKTKTANEKRVTMKLRISELITVLALGASFPLYGSTVAYWRFEEGPSDGLLYHTVGDGVYQQAVADSSGNGYALSAWTSGAWGSSFYRNNTLPAHNHPPSRGGQQLLRQEFGRISGYVYRSECRHKNNHPRTVYD